MSNAVPPKGYAAGTQLLAPSGYTSINDHLNQRLEVWNGDSFVEYKVIRSSAEPVPIANVWLSNGMCVRWSLSQTWMMSNGKRLVSTLELKSGMELKEKQLPYWSNEPDVDFMVVPYDHAVFFGAGRHREDKDRPTFLPFNKSATFVPLHESRSLKLSWLTGLLDAEGQAVHLFQNILWVTIKSQLREFLNLLAELLRSLGVCSSIEKKLMGMWCLRISASEWGKLLSNHGEVMTFKCFHAPAVLLPCKTWTVVKLQIIEPAYVYQLVK
jgi:hypothetical protein